MKEQLEAIRKSALDAVAETRTAADLEADHLDFVGGRKAAGIGDDHAVKAVVRKFQGLLFLDRLCDRVNCRHFNSPWSESCAEHFGRVL